MKKVAIINLGCKVNKYEADSMTDLLIAAGYEIVEDEDIADIYIVNTCSVTHIAEKKSRQMLRRVRRKNENAIVIAVGCFVNARHDEIEDMDFIDIAIGNNKKHNIVSIINEYEMSKMAGDCYTDINLSKEYEEMGIHGIDAMDHKRAYIKVQDGCNQFCSYCIIPYVRGRVRSRKPSDVLEEIGRLAGQGVSEFVITGIHVSSYGSDFVKEEMDAEDKGIEDLGDLIVELSKIPEVKRLRLGSLEPRIITKEFVDKILTTDKVCPHFHLSLQSACNETLKRMNRKYSYEEYKEACDLLRKAYEKPAITTDVIVGFPGETEEEFNECYEHLKELNLYEIHVFKYSVRQGTRAEKFENQVSENDKNKRSDILLELTANQKKAYEESLHGVKDSILIEEKTDEGYVGHTKRYVRVVLNDVPADGSDIVDYDYSNL